MDRSDLTSPGGAGDYPGIHIPAGNGVPPVADSHLAGATRVYETALEYGEITPSGWLAKRL